jgi:glycosyltransferase involved in cell wall biosynthesis
VVLAPLRVTILNWRDTSHPEGGGSERYVERVAAGLAADGCAVTVRCARHAGSPVRERRAGFELRRAGGRITVYPRALAGLVVDRLLRRGPDVVLDVQNGVPFFARLVAGCPVLVLVHHVHREQWGVALPPVMARLGWWLESRAAPRVLRGCQYVTVSEVTRGELTGLGVEAAHVAIVRNGVDAVPQVDGRRSPSPRLVVLGRLVPHKRVEHALEVLARLLPEFPDLKLDVVGEGWWHDRLVAAARTQGVEHAVEFHGYLPEETKHEVLAAAWVQLAPSLKEGWGLMVVEAAQHRVPTIAYRAAGGLAESVRDGMTGVLVDDLDGMTRATRALLRDAERRACLGAAAQAHAGGFTWRAAASRMFGLLRRAASGAPPVATADDEGPGAGRVSTTPRIPATGSLAPDPLAP